ncbi:DHH family phosphoesterase [Candidatus Saccharibacteria bacterium]|nr:DHH family phosphoesterase [Candidatus Saccharibacteria bacterium]
MTIYKEAEEIRKIVSGAKTIAIIQADNPDVDSLASSLALEQILHDLGKDPIMYCGVDLPSYMRYLPGSDRVNKDMPHKFDASIIVDTSSDSLLEQLDTSGAKAWVAAKPTIVLDHHATKATISFANVICNYEAVATGEVIYELSRQLGWTVSLDAKKLITMAILSDSLGLTTEATTARSIHIVAELVEGGVSLPEIENARRETMRRDPVLIHYKGQLLERVEFHDSNRITTLTIPWEEIEKYSPLYNPPMLVIDDMRLAKDTKVAICFKLYPGGKITTKIRSNWGSGIADKLAEHFGGGGHAYAAGFKVQDGRDFNTLKIECIKVAAELLDSLKTNQHEAL